MQKIKTSIIRHIPVYEDIEDQDDDIKKTVSFGSCHFIHFDSVARPTLCDTL